MIDPVPSWLSSFPELAAIDDKAWRDALAQARMTRYPPGAAIYKDGEGCESFILILEGRVKVERISASGQEITLYHLQPGQICELTTSCLMSGKCYHADAIAETEVRAVLIPRAAFQAALSGSPAFRRYVYDTVEQGMSDLLSLLETVVSTPTGRRLAAYLAEQARVSGDTLHATHHEIATELGTSREVVSRLLKDFEHHGWVRLHRGHIEILDREALEEMAVGGEE